MKKYKNIITLNKNSRGCYILDTIKGCNVCKSEKPKGCYENCYAKGMAGRYGFDFSNVAKREFVINGRQLSLFGFIDSAHIRNIIKDLLEIDMPFVRIGEMGDPSEDWEHTINVCKIIAEANKPIVIITKHWNTIPDKLLVEISKMNICINTSISGLDTNKEIEHRLSQYNRLKGACNSVLRIVSCDFNNDNNEGYVRSKTQERLFKNEVVIDTVFRPDLNNPLVINKIINIKKVKFLKSEVIASIFNDKTYFGYCNNCPDMCGINK